LVNLFEISWSKKRTSDKKNTDKVAPKKGRNSTILSELNPPFKNIMKEERQRFRNAIPLRMFDNVFCFMFVGF
jgi:hypothetical protein